MMRLPHPFIFAFVLILAFSHSAHAEFSDVVQNFQKNDLAAAKTELLALEKEHPSDPTLLLNLGVIALKEKRSGAALGLWRKGLASHPTDDALNEAVGWTKVRLPKAEIARDFDTWESWREAVVLRISPLDIIIFSAALLMAAGWLLLRWWGRRKRALEQDLEMPPVPTGGIVLLLLFCFTLSVQMSLFIDHLDIRGTILPAKVEVRSAPDKGATALFELFEGMEVLVDDVRTVDDQTWRHIVYPGGLAGWVTDSSVFTTADASERAFP